MNQIILSETELERIIVLEKLKSGLYTQAEAGAQLGIGDRQIRRLLRRFEIDGVSGIKRPECNGNRLFDSAVKEQILTAVRAEYSDFGPSFAAEKLLERQGLTINRETLRQWMIEAGLRKVKSRKTTHIHQSRERRPRLGELVQIDGSHHDWFEGRAPKCTLLVFIDDATSKILAMHFELTETTIGYLRCLEKQLINYGRPLALYSDKHSVFKVNRAPCDEEKLADTQFHRVLKSLSIELICAHSSQAKGRVERANQTLQDRLIKEMRLRAISTISKANTYLPEFIAQHNKKFAVIAENPDDAHRSVYHSKVVLKRILSVQETRKLTKNLEFSYNNRLYQVLRIKGGFHLRHATVTICEHIDNTQEVLYGDDVLRYKKLSKPPKQPIVANSKELNSLLDGMINTCSRELPFTALPTSRQPIHA